MRRKVARVAPALAAVVWIAACDSPQHPELCGSIPEQTLLVGETVTADACFDDPDGDMLTFEVFNSDPAVATAAATGSTITVTAVSPGLSVITVLAADPTGLKAQQSFRVVVPNRPPAAVGTIDDRELMVGEVAVIDVAGHFSEPDGQPLAYSAASSDSNRVAVSAEGAVVTVAALAKGTVTVTVTAADPGGLTAEQTFQVKVPNRPPVPVDSIAAREIMVGRADTLDLSPFFSDPDGDPLTYVAAVADSAVAAASVTGSTLTLTGLAKGETPVAVTATDDEGLSAAQRFHVTVPNRPPMATDTIAARTLFRGEADTLDLSRHFSDPDGDPLSWRVEASDSTVVAARLSAPSGRLTVTALSQGEAAVTVVATDTEGLTAHQSFAVTVPNRSPAPADTLPDLTLHKRETTRLNLTRYFTDPDGDALSYEIESTEPVVATAIVTADTIIVRARAKGRATLAVTATDPGALSARQTFAVTVLNRPPAITDSIPDQTIFRSQRRTLDLDLHFGDPDGDTLAYAAVSSNRRFVRVEVDGGTLTLTAPRKGAAEVTVTATDPDSLTVEQTFAVVVGNRAPVAVGAFPDLELGRGDRITLPVDRYFSDPDRDALEYAGETSDPGVARAAVGGNLVTLTGVSDGQTTLTLTATDPDGLMAAQTSRIIVFGSGNTPRPVGQIPSQTITEGSTHRLIVSGRFEDPNGDPLTYDASTSNPGIATASASGATVTLTGVASGQTTLTVTATDPDGNFATLSTPVSVVVPGQAPVARTPIPDQTVAVGRARTISVAGHFQDPDGGSLGFAASSSNPDVVTASASGSGVTLTGVAEGRATVTVTATDSDGLSVSQSVSVTVRAADRAPVAVGTLGALSLEAGGLDIFDAAPYFRDPDGDGLTYGAGTADPTIAAASAAGSIVTVRGVSAGTTTLSLTATDPSGLSATHSTTVEVTQPPRGPEAVGTVPDDSIASGDQLRIDMAPYFTHPDGLALVYAAGTSSRSVATANMSGATLLVRGQGRGTATITVIASDPAGRTATQRFGVQVTRIDTGFEISLGFAPGTPAPVESAMLAAATTFEAVVSGTEFTDVTFSEDVSCQLYNYVISVDIGYLDDLAVGVGSDVIDGPGGTLAAATLCVARGNGDPALGIVLFDNSDLLRLQLSGSLADVALHEIAHVVGIGVGSGWDSSIVNPSGSNPDADTHFPGTRAVAAFNAAGGTAYSGGKVPVENGRDDSHWRGSVMDGELMNPRFSLGESHPLSAITIQALADLGYSVDVGRAQPYTLPSPDIAPDIVAGAPPIDLRDDVYRGPVIQVDADGNVVRVVPGPDGRMPPPPLRPGEAAARADSVIRITIDRRR